MAQVIEHPCVLKTRKTNLTIGPLICQNERTALTRPPN